MMTNVALSGSYASRAISLTEQCYAQIVKEALGITWARERFADYLIGLKFHIKTDHKPLEHLVENSPPVRRPTAQ